VETARRARHGVSRPLVGPLLAAGLALLLVAALAATTGRPARWWGGADGVHPALPGDVATVPLAAPEPAPGGTGGYTVLEREDDGSGRPVRWDPCRPIHYVIRAAGAPVGGPAAVLRAIAQVQRVTGLRFTFDGYTQEVPRAERATLDRARYGDRWAPVLIAWTDPAEYPDMTGFAGLGGPEAVAGRHRGQRRYVTGVVLLNRDHLRRVVHWPGGSARMSAVVLHEFGHLVGLDHVDDPGQLMYKQPSEHAPAFAAGDRRGFAVLGAGPCFRDF
jgi:hypothetical protein